MDKFFSMILILEDFGWKCIKYIYIDSDSEVFGVNSSIEKMIEINDEAQFTHYYIFKSKILFLRWLSTFNYLVLIFDLLDYIHYMFGVYCLPLFSILFSVFFWFCLIFCFVLSLALIASLISLYTILSFVCEISTIRILYNTYYYWKLTFLHICSVSEYWKLNTLFTQSFLPFLQLYLKLLLKFF